MPLSSDMARAARAKRLALESGDAARTQAADKTIGLIKITEFVSRTLATMPPLTDAEAAQVAELLRGTASAA